MEQLQILTRRVSWVMPLKLIHTQSPAASSFSDNKTAENKTQSTICSYLPRYFFSLLQIYFIQLELEEFWHTVQNFQFSKGHRTTRNVKHAIVHKSLAQYTRSISSMRFCKLDLLLMPKICINWVNPECPENVKHMVLIHTKGERSETNNFCMNLAHKKKKKWVTQNTNLFR